jgi:hypothetical protein
LASRRLQPEPRVTRLPRPLEQVHWWQSPEHRSTAARGPVRPDLVDPVTLERPVSRYSKPKGGLWTSPADSEWGWQQWAEVEMPQWLGRRWTLEVRPGARLFVIDSMADLVALYEKFPVPAEQMHMYGHPSGLFVNEKNVDFEAMAQSGEYEGLWLTAEGHWASRLTFSGPDNGLTTYGWDCETVYWFVWWFDTWKVDDSRVG